MTCMYVSMWYGLASCVENGRNYIDEYLSPKNKRFKQNSDKKYLLNFLFNKIL